MTVPDSWEITAAAKPKPKKPRKPEEVWYDVHKHPEGVPGGMGKSPEHHLRGRGWRGHEINEGAGRKTIQYRHQDYPNFVISYGGGSGTKPDHNFRILHMGINTNVPKVTRAYSVAEAMNKVEELHGLQSGLVVQPMTHGAAARTGMANQWGVAGPGLFQFYDGKSPLITTVKKHDNGKYTWEVREDSPTGRVFSRGTHDSMLGAMGHAEDAHSALRKRAAIRPKTIAEQPNIALDKTFVAPTPPPSRQDMTDHDHHPIGAPDPEFPTQPDRESDWPKKQKQQLKEIPDLPKYKPQVGKVTSILRRAAALTWEELA